MLVTADFICFEKGREELDALDASEEKAFVSFSGQLERLARGYATALCRVHSIDIRKTADTAAEDVAYLKSITVIVPDADSPEAALRMMRQADTLESVMHRLCDYWMQRSWEVSMRAALEMPSKVSLVLKRLFYLLDRSITFLRSDRTRRQRLGWKLPNVSSHQPNLASKTGNLYQDTKAHVELSAKFREVVDGYCNQLDEDEEESFAKSCMRKGFHVSDIRL